MRFGKAPAWRSKRTASLLPIEQAQCSGVMPCVVVSTLRGVEHLLYQSTHGLSFRQRLNLAIVAVHVCSMLQEKGHAANMPAVGCALQRRPP